MVLVYFFLLLFFWFHWRTLLPLHMTLVKLTRALASPNHRCSWANEDPSQDLSCFFCFFFWSIIDLQCCVNSWYIALWFIYTHTHIYILFQIFFPYRLLQNIKYSPLHYTLGLCWLCILYSYVYMLMPSS